MKAVWNNAVVAQATDIVEVEGNKYFPISSLNKEYLLDSDTHTTCPWKGVASYYSLNVNGSVNKDAVWFYPNPKAGAEAVANRVAFWRGVEIKE